MGKCFYLQFDLFGVLYFRIDHSFNYNEIVQKYAQNQNHYITRAMYEICSTLQITSLKLSTLFIANF